MILQPSDKGERGGSLGVDNPTGSKKSADLCAREDITLDNLVFFGFMLLFAQALSLIDMYAFGRVAGDRIDTAE